jgi:cysteine synthase
MARIPTNISQHVGNTPVVQLTRVAPAEGVELYAKL